MFLANLKTLLVMAGVNTFDQTYPVQEFQNLHVSVEFPNDRANYPAVWADFEPTGPLERGGVNQQLVVPSGNGFKSFIAWRYQGFATYTLVSLSSLERDRLFDEWVKVIGFAGASPETSTFRQTIDNNPYIACNFDFDQIQIQGKSEVPGTPWGTEEVLYEITVAVQCFGEFYSDQSATTLVALSEVTVQDTVQGGPTGQIWQFPHP